GPFLGPLPAPAHPAEHLPAAGQLLGAAVEGHAVRTPPVQLEGVPSGTASHVEDAVPGLDAEPLEIHGQQGRAPFVQGNAQGDVPQPLPLLAASFRYFCWAMAAR